VHPLAVRYLILPLHEMLVGRGTLSYLRRLEASQWWPRQRLRELQERKLRRLLSHANAHCPFYRRRLHDAGIDPDRAVLADLTKLPTLSKAQIKDQTGEMIDRRVRGGLIDLCTGGSTGQPLAFKIDRRRQAADQAARARSRRWFGIDLGQRELYLWGSPLEHSTQDRARTLRDRLTNHRLLDAFDMTPRTMSRYLDVVRRYDPVHLFGYPSSLARLCRHAAACGRSIASPSLRAVFVTGEVFQKSDRAMIEEAVSVPVADGYGSREGGFVAHQCPAGAYHVTMESHIVELLDERGRPAAEGDIGEIVLTHLDALGMPFIRYRTGDLAIRRQGDCPCGRGLEMLRAIEGRRTDMLRTASGGYAHGLSVIYELREVPQIEEFRVCQRANLDLDISIVQRAEITPGRLEQVAGRLRLRIGDTIAVRFNLVNRIAPDPSGKHRHVVAQSP